MIVTDLKISKVPHDDPRYPDADAMKRQDGSVVPFFDVYVCQCTTDDGQDFECPFFITETDRDFTPQKAGDTLRLFAAAVSRVPWGEKKVA